ncbi:M56 family metallopeptidase [Paucihalobacter ruber]|uniref:M56 family metallopeptidase n=1 Tax=Paucihalobacter ruber TaxID=2567861 RepID=A0A506PNK8_9FLAO|nr:M56 family metallopeptidase [Paucihalobacter ruber]TPV35486.1 M56 family metallopeptidase [Paucihalobacter ruber]
MNYLLKINILIVAFFLFYLLLLRPTTFFKSNRWYLLTGLILSAILPFVVLTNYQYYQPVELQNFTIQYSEAPVKIKQVQDIPFNYLPYLFGVYIVGVIALVIKSGVSLFSVVTLIFRLKQHAQHTIFTNKTNAAFSFFKFIAVNPEKFTQEELKLVLDHEQIHVKQWHSLDIVVAHLFAVLLWFNPFVWLYKKAIQENLEFITDSEVIKHSASRKTYQKLLLKTSLPDLQPIFSNTFYKSSIKNRIVMLNKQKSHQLLQPKYALLIPVIAVFLTSMNTKTVYVPITNEIDSDVIQSQKDIRIVFDKSLTGEQLETIKSDLKNDGVTMVIKKIARNSKGDISEISIDFETVNGTASYAVTEPDGIEPFYFEMSAEDGGFGVYSIASDKNTKWRLKQTKLIKNHSNNPDTLVFSLDSSKTLKNIQKITNNLLQTDSMTTIGLSYKSANSTNSNENVAFYINDKIANAEALKNLQPDNIESITVIKDKKELKKLNHEDKDGVIKIVIKNPWSISVNPISMSEIPLKTNFENDTTNLLSFKKEMIKHSWFLDNFNSDINASNYSINPNNIHSPTIVVYMLNGKIVDESKIKNLKQQQIQSVEIHKKNKKLDSMGFSGKDGLIEIKTQPLSNHLLQNQKNSSTYYRVDSAQYTDDKDASKNSITQYLYKETTNQDLQDQIKKLKEVGVTMSYSKLKRNKSGHITNIKVKLQNEDGQEIEDTFSEKDGAVVMEYGMSNGKLKISKLTE